MGEGDESRSKQRQGQLREVNEPGEHDGSWQLTEEEWAKQVARELGHYLPEDTEAHEEYQRKIKKNMRLDEMRGDVFRKTMEGGKLAPSDVMRICVVMGALEVAVGYGIPFPYDDVYGWIAFQEAFDEFGTLFDEVFVFKKASGRPTDNSTNALLVAAIIDRMKFSSATARYKYDRDYTLLLVDACELRLMMSDEWRSHPAQYERRRTLDREFKAAKTAVDRVWARVHGREAPRPDIDAQQRESLKEWVLERLSRRS